jgi:hypothetical protein
MRKSSYVEYKHLVGYISVEPTNQLKTSLSKHFDKTSMILDGLKYVFMQSLQHYSSCLHCHLASCKLKVPGYCQHFLSGLLLSLSTSTREQPLSTITCS